MTPPLPALHHPFGEEIFPDSQTKGFEPTALILNSTAFLKYNLEMYSYKQSGELNDPRKSLTFFLSSFITGLEIPNLYAAFVSMEKEEELWHYLC